MNKIVIITGGASGIGFEMTKLFLQKGFNVAVIDRNKEYMKKVYNLQNQVKDISLLPFIGDVRDENFVNKTVKAIAKDFEIAYLINNAAIIKACHFSENTKEELDDVLGAVVGAILMTAQVLPHMKKINSGKIVNVMSSAALLGRPMESMYCCCKYALKGFTNSLKNEVNGTNIKVVGVFPGGINTPFYDNVRHYTPKEVSDKYMNPTRVAEVIVENCLKIDTLNISSIKIDRL